MNSQPVGHLNIDIGGQHWQFICFLLIRFGTNKSLKANMLSLYRKFNQCETYFCLVGQNIWKVCKNFCKPQNLKQNIKNVLQENTLYRFEVSWQNLHLQHYTLNIVIKENFRIQPHFSTVKSCTFLLYLIVLISDIIFWQVTTQHVEISSF